NDLSLMALTVATGFVVDDGIVVLENISRRVEQGVAPMQAALQGTREVGFTVLSMSVSLIAVFIPILLMGGIIGRLFREFAVTLSIAIGLSAIVSLTVTPAMAGHLLRARHAAPPGRLARVWERSFNSLVAGYGRALGWVLAHGPLMVVLTFASLGLTVFLAIVVPKGLFPQQDTGLISGFSEASQDISSKAMKAAQEKVNA